MFYDEENPLHHQEKMKISVKNLSKCYQVFEKPRDRLLQMFFRKKKFYKEFWALKNISLDVGDGETVGIIGRNGSGKSTLLQIICGTLSSTSGNVTVKGRIAALLELGSGFNPEFTGRENVYLNASLLGLTKDETDRKLDDILEFAEIGDFIDQPVKNYSSGMVIRLAFAVQAQIEPDILVVDEALAVGDAKFQAKCFNRLKQLKEQGTSILLVTHSSEQIVTHCSKAILIDNGSMIAAGEPRDVVNRYMDLLFGKEKKDNTPPPAVEKKDTAPVFDGPNLNIGKDVFNTRNSYNPHEYRWGDGSATIMDYYLSSEREEYPSIINSGQKIKLLVTVKFNETMIRPIFGITIKTKEGVTVYGANSETMDVTGFGSIGKKDSVITARVAFKCSLAPGDYFISLGIATREGNEIIPRDRRYDAIHMHVAPEKKFFGLIDLGMEISI
jgi:ABC-type polysaccharide/polyol phosphate transport system, ATPase component